MIKGIFRIAYTGLITGILLSIMLNRSTWLDMRFNTPIIIPLSVITCFIIFIFKKYYISLTKIVLAELIFASIFIIIYRYRLDAFLIIPAHTVREGFYLKGINLRIINTAFLALLLIVNFPDIALPKLREKK